MELLRSFIFTPGPLKPSPLHHSQKARSSVSCPQYTWVSKGQDPVSPLGPLSPTQFQPQQDQDFHRMGWTNSLIPTSYKHDNSISPSLHFFLIIFVLMENMPKIKTKKKTHKLSVDIFTYLLPGFLAGFLAPICLQSKVARIGNGFVSCFLYSRSCGKHFFER